MDDAMEDEVLYEVMATHACLAWRYVASATSQVAHYLLLQRPSGGEKWSMALLREPGALVALALVVLGASVALQALGIGRWVVRAQCLLGSSTSATFRTMGTMASSPGVQWEAKEGMVGLYALQGRRDNMEDRYAILQDVDVGGHRTMSFVGVFDGHGGQYTAEFVKENLFRNLIEKIKYLRSQKFSHPAKENKKNGNNNTTNKGRAKRTTDRCPRGSSLTCDTSLESCFKGDLNHVSPEGEEEAPSAPCKEPPSAPSQEAPSAPRVQEVLQGEPRAPEGSMKDDPYGHGTRKATSMPREKLTEEHEDDSEGNASTADRGYIDPYKNINYTRLLTDQVMAVDKQVVDRCKSQTNMSGTTALIAVLDGELLVIGNVGDSRAVMGDIKGSTIPLSFDHKPNQLKERRRIREAGGYVTFTGVWRVAGILATSRALGDFPLKEPRRLVTAEPDVLTFRLRDHGAHFVILATDGLWDVLTNEEAVSFVRRHVHDADYGARALALHAYQKGSQDNITVAVLNVYKP